MNKLIELIRSLWWGPIVSVIAALAILVFRDPPHHESGDAFDYIGAFAFGLLIAGILWLMLYATDIERRQDLEEKARRTSSAKFTAVTAPAELSVTRIEQDLALRVKEASDFKAAIERKNAELDALRSKLNRKDLVAVNEAIAALYQSASAWPTSRSTPARSSIAFPLRRRSRRASWSKYVTAGSASVRTLSSSSSIRAASPFTSDFLR